jgi:hypothetical protein
MKIHSKVHPIRLTNRQPRSHPAYQVPQRKGHLHIRRWAGIGWRNRVTEIELPPDFLTDYHARASRNSTHTKGVPAPPLNRHWAMYDRGKDFLNARHSS